MKKVILGLSLAAIGLAGAATAQTATQRPDPLGDKTVTKAEAQAKANEMFAMMDGNKDGKLDQSDRAAHKGQMFDKLDTDKNGSVSKEEFAAAQAARKDGEGRKGMRGGHGRGGKMMLHMADANKDGAISRDEFAAAHAKMFDSADANKDGKLTPEERKAHHAKMRAAMGSKRGGRGAGGHAGHGDMPAPPPAN